MPVVSLSVKNHLRKLGYTGRVLVDQSIIERPAQCEAVQGRCAIVEIRVGFVRGRTDTGSAEMGAAPSAVTMRRGTWVTMSTPARVPLALHAARLTGSSNITSEGVV